MPLNKRRMQLSVQRKRMLRDTQRKISSRRTALLQTKPDGIALRLFCLCCFTLFQLSYLSQTPLVSHCLTLEKLILVFVCSFNVHAQL